MEWTKVNDKFWHHIVSVHPHQNSYQSIHDETWHCREEASQFVSSICKDAGYQSIAGQIDVFGKLCVIITGFPIIHTVFEMLERFL